MNRLLEMEIVTKVIEAGSISDDIHAWAVYPKTHHLAFRVRVLIDFLAEAFGEEPYWERCLK